MARRKTETAQKETDPLKLILPTRHRLKCKNHIQKEYANLITEKEIVIAAGPAGVGKSYVAIARGIELLQNVSNSYKKMMIINPAVEAEEKLGYIPGSLREKLDPFVGSSIDIIDKIVGAGNRVKLEEAGILQVGSLGHIRGKSIDNTILIMEEAQNISPSQMKTLLTRIGDNSKFVISGDLEQSDRYKDSKKTGLFDALKRHSNIDAIGVIKFREADIVRNPLIKKILDNYKSDVTIEPNKEKVSDKPQKSNRQLLTESVSKPRNKKPNWYRKLQIWFKKNFKW